MAIQEEEEGIGSAGAPLTVGLALSGFKSSNYVLQWALARFANGKDKDKPTPTFKLIHVLTPVLAVPTPLGNLIPIDEVRMDIADAYAKEVQLQAQEMLHHCKNMCDKNKVEVEILLIKGNDVSDTISNLVALYQIQVLVVGKPTCRSAFTRKSSGNKTLSKICKSIPSFCTTYIVSKDGLSSVYSPGLGSDTSSGMPKRNSGSSDSQVLSEEMSLRSDLSDSPARTLIGLSSLPCSNLASENLKSSSSGERHCSFTLYDYISGSASVYADKDRRITSCTDGESSISSKLWASGKLPTEGSSLQGLMLSDSKDDVNIEVENLRLELRDIQDAYKLVQNESVDASHQVVELAAKHMEGKAQLREIQSRVDKFNDEIQEEKVRRCATEEVVTHVKDLVRAEVMQKNWPLIKASKEADQKSRLEKLLVLNGNSYPTFTWEEIDNATSSFSESHKIGTGSNGTVYKGHLNHLDVAIKVLHSDDSSSTKHFKQELEVLGRIHHPHLLMLLGACPDMGCVVYEYMENGSLADRLQCINGTAPIPWFHRFRIAWEIVSALVFLRSTKPNPIIHRDLKPENVLLDRDLVSKIGDVGLSTLVPLKDSSSSGTMYKKTGLAGTLFYIDPEYHRTGQVSVKSDTYALGMVILQLLTARSPIGLPELVEQAVEDGQLMDLLDEGAGNWPVKEAHDLAQLGLSCLEMRSKNRPDLKNMVAVELKRLKDIAGVASRPVQVMTGLGPPSHFVCPILKDYVNINLEELRLELKACINSLQEDLKMSSAAIFFDRKYFFDLKEKQKAFAYTGCEPNFFIEIYGPQVTTLERKCKENDKFLKKLIRGLKLDSNVDMLNEVLVIQSKNRSLSKSASELGNKFYDYNNRINTELSWISEFVNTLEKISGKFICVTSKITDLQKDLLVESQMMEEFVPSKEVYHDFESKLVQLRKLLLIFESIKRLSSRCVSIGNTAFGMWCQRKDLTTIFVQKRAFLTRFCEAEQTLKGKIPALEKQLNEHQLKIDNLRKSYDEKLSCLPEVPSYTFQKMIGNSDFSWRFRKYNGRNILPPVRTQGRGDCTSVATVAGTESLVKKEQSVLSPYKGRPFQPMEFTLKLSHNHLQDLVTQFYANNKRKGNEKLTVCLEQMQDQGVVAEEGYNNGNANVEDFQRYRINGFEKLHKAVFGDVCKILEGGNVLIGNFRITTDYHRLGPDDIYQITDNSVYETNSAGQICSHCVVIVGFGVTPDGLCYYIFQNSYGPDWGSGGYGRVEAASMQFLYSATVAGATHFYPVLVT